MDVDSAVSKYLRHHLVEDIYPDMVEFHQYNLKKFAVYLRGTDGPTIIEALRADALRGVIIWLREAGMARITVARGPGIQRTY